MQIVMKAGNVDVLDVFRDPLSQLREDKPVQDVPVEAGRTGFALPFDVFG
jgi:hypothetical protein